MSLSPLHAWVLVDKPEGLTSTQVTTKVKSCFKAKKAGHGGTLDPFATGLLPIALNEATKTVPFVMEATKTYEFTVRWGIETDTDDCEGTVTVTNPNRPSEANLQAALPHFTGPLLQQPPIYSALKVGGQRSYSLARKGEKPELAPRQITVESLRLVRVIDQDHACFEVTCGKGTYVRSLGRDLGRFLNTCAHLTALKRTKIGRFQLSHAISLDNLLKVRHIAEQSEYLVSIRQALADIPALHLDERETQNLRLGRSIPNHWTHLGETLFEQPLLLACYNKEAVALVKCISDQILPVRVFNIVEEYKRIDDVD